MYRQSSYYGYNKPQVVNVQSNSYIIQYGMYLIFGLLFFIAFNIIFDTLYNKYFIQNTFISWWRNGIKNIKQGDTLFNIDHVLEFENDNKIVYYIKTMFWSIKQSSAIDMLKTSNFLNNYVKKNIYIKNAKSHDTSSYITPRHLVRSIQFNTDDGQIGMNSWYNLWASKGNGGGSSLNPIKWGDNYQEWQKRIAWWCGCISTNDVYNPPSSDKKPSFWIKDKFNFFTVNDGSDVNIPIPPTGTTSTDSKTKDRIIALWENWNSAITKLDVNEPRIDNVFARFGISFKSPIIAWLANNSDEHGDELNNRGAALKLIGLSENGQPLSEGTLGGWLGYINDSSMKSGVSPTNALFESEHTYARPTNNNTPKGNGCNNKTGKPQQNTPSRGDWIKDGASVGLGALMILFGGPEGVMMGLPQLLAGADLANKSIGTSKCGRVGDS